MAATRTDPPQLEKPKRADARRNYDNLLNTARAVFKEQGTEASLEEIARQAGVGIGTLYRHFPTRHHLLEAVYIDEVDAICKEAEGLDDLEPWDALDTWLRKYVGFAATKRAVAAEMLTYTDLEADIFKHCRAALMGTGGTLLERAQEAGVVRPDATFMDVARLISGVATVQNVDPEEAERILTLALDGLRYQPQQ
jgi:AcrR family transcriptional regulator